jgi:transcription elongation factor GreA
MSDKVQLTKVGKEELERELRKLIDVEREEVKKQLAEARAQGDLSENADYDAARNRQAEVENRIKQIEDILSNYELIDDEKSSKRKGDKIALGSTVTIRFLETGKEAKYMIVGTVESDPFNNKISNACPLGEALIGKSVGDIVDVKAKKNYKIEVVKIGA